MTSYAKVRTAKLAFATLVLAVVVVGFFAVERGWLTPETHPLWILAWAAFCLLSAACLIGVACVWLTGERGGVAAGPWWSDGCTIYHGRGNCADFNGS